jgi:hypothetical protein
MVKRFDVMIRQGFIRRWRRSVTMRKALKLGVPRLAVSDLDVMDEYAEGEDLGKPDNLRVIRVQ